jgi:hypothetical protein
MRNVKRGETNKGGVGSLSWCMYLDEKVVDMLENA